MEPIRVLHVVGRMDRGGIETLIMNIYRNIDRNKVQFDFLAHYGKVDADYNEEIITLGGKVHEMPKIKSTNRTYYHKIFQYINALNRFFKIHTEYKIIHIHMTNTARILIPISKKYGNIKVIITHSHLSRATNGLKGYLTNILQKNIEKSATDFFACSLKAAEWFYSNELIKSGRVKIINNAVDTEKFDFNYETRTKIRDKYNLIDYLVIGHVGRFYEQKNHKFLIQIFRKLLEQNAMSKLLLIGEGELKSDMEKLCKQYNIDNNVIFLGNRSDVNDLMQAMDVLVMPSLFEGLPVVGIEAQSSGLSCVFSDTITSELKVTDNVSFVSLQASVEAWVEAIIQASKNDRKSNKTELTEKGYDIKNVAKTIQDYYEEGAKI